MFIASSLSFATFLLQAAYPPPFPREGARKVLENEHVTIWDVLWEQGKPTPMHEHVLPAVGVLLVPGSVRQRMADGTTRASDLGVLGEVSYAEPGRIHSEEGLATPAARAILIELKPRVTRAALPARPDGPPVFGAATPGARKAFENERVVVWDVSLDPARGLPAHHHTRDSVVVALASAKIRSIATTGEATVSESALGDAVFRPRDREHREEVIEGTPRNVIVELK